MFNIVHYYYLVYFLPVLIWSLFLLDLLISPINPSGITMRNALLGNTG